MSSRHIRVCSLFLLALTGLGLGTGTILGQDILDNKFPAPQKPDFRDEQRMRAMRDGKARVGGSEAEKNKAAFKAVAEFYIYSINDAKYYGIHSGDGQLKPRLPNSLLDSVFTELKRYLLIPAMDSRFTTDQAEYIDGFANALDDAIRPMLKSREPLVRMNAARALEVVAESGAAVHAKTITTLLKDPKTRPEVLLYVYKAAGKLLSAYHPLAIRNPDPNRHAIPNELLVPLLQALENHILKNPPVAEHVVIEKPAPKALPQGGEAEPAAAPAAEPEAGGKLETTALTTDQIEIIRFFRRDAVRALAKVRVDVVGGDGEPEVRPAYTLAQVAVSDPAILPAPGAIEVIEAVIGLLHISPSNKLNIDELANVVAIGLGTFAQLKAVPGDTLTPEQQLISWKLYAARLVDAFTYWRGSVNRNPRALAAQAIIRSLSDTAMSEVVTRLDRTGSAVGSGININRLTEWLNRNVPKDRNRSLFNDSPKYKLGISQRPGN
ncbi:MAG: hypothetical protein LC104_11520 [Bacteroidales bacterium]|nr:hypothetical protein [Bacteroidales bacterium]